MQFIWQVKVKNSLAVKNSFLVRFVGMGDILTNMCQELQNNEPAEFTMN